MSFLIIEIQSTPDVKFNNGIEFTSGNFIMGITFCSETIRSVFIVLLQKQRTKIQLISREHKMIMDDKTMINCWYPGVLKVEIGHLKNNQAHALIISQIDSLSEILNLYFNSKYQSCPKIEFACHNHRVQSLLPLTPYHN